jgi:hypothetical protein
LLSSLQDVDLPPFINKEKRNCNWKRRKKIDIKKH